MGDGPMMLVPLLLLVIGVTLVSAGLAVTVGGWGLVGFGLLVTAAAVVIDWEASG